MAASAVTIHSLPTKIRAATRAMSARAVRMRFMGLDEDTCCGSAPTDGDADEGGARFVSVLDIRDRSTLKGDPAAGN
jgi:hypothetical protein